jgi:protein subunit release factor A
MGDDDFEVTTGCDAVHPDQRGGQHVAKQCTGVRIMHKPSGISVLSKDERSQHGNRVKAYERLRRLIAADLTSDEVEALRDLRSRVGHIHPWSPLHSAALNVLERLLEGAK